MTFVSVGLLFLSCTKGPRPFVGDSTPETGIGTEWSFQTAECDSASSWKRVDVRYHVGCGLHSDGCVECWGDAYRVPVTGWNDTTTAPAGPFSDLVLPADEIDQETFACALGSMGLACWGVGLGPSLFDVQQGSELAAHYRGVCWSDLEGALACNDLEPSSAARPSVDIAMPREGLVCSLAQEGDLDCYAGGAHQVEVPIPEDVVAWTALGTGEGQLLSIADGVSVYGWGFAPDSLPARRLAQSAGTDPYIDAVALFGGPGCALRESGYLDCWGEWAPITPEGRFAQISMGCGVTTEGALTCWAPGDRPSIADAPVSAR